MTNEQYAIAVLHRFLDGKPLDTMVDQVAREKVVSFADARARLRPPEPGSLAVKMQDIDDAFRPRPS